MWDNNFTTAAVIQWFGEIATTNGIPPLTQMGDGILPPPPTAAHMFELCEVDPGEWTCLIRNEQSARSISFLDADGHDALLGTAATAGRTR